MADSGATEGEVEVANGAEELAAVAAEVSSEEAQQDSKSKEPISFDEEVELPELEESERIALIQALLFSHSEPITIGKLATISGFEKKEVEDLVESLEMNLEMEDSGIELCKIAGSVQLRTKEKFGPYLRLLRSGRPKRLSNAAFETLSIIAYRQPIIKSDVEKIRGVDATPTIKTLLSRRLLKIVGHRDSPGQPALYGTTDEFLKLFGLNSLAELPTLRDLKELEADPGEIEEDEAQEELEFEAAEEQARTEAVEAEQEGAEQEAVPDDVTLQ